MKSFVPLHRLQKGRGALSNPTCRYNAFSMDALPQSEMDLDPESCDLPPLQTDVFIDKARSILNKHTDPDVPFGLSMNPYRGCEHGCIYCYARPSHAYLGWSPGLDFETKLTYKPDAAALLKKAFSRPGYRCIPILIGSNTDPYQPIERTFQITRQLLEVLLAHKHPAHIITKSSLIERDVDLLSILAKQGLVSVGISITTLDTKLARIMEPRAATPQKRLTTMRLLSEKGIPTTAMICPVIPGLTDHELEKILHAAKQAGAAHAHYSIVRLPNELAELFSDWISCHHPNRAKHILSLIKQCHQGAFTTAGFQKRMAGQGVHADLIKQRFLRSYKSLGLGEIYVPLRCDLFQSAEQKQMGLF